VVIKCWMPRYNWGDQINKDLCEMISGWPVRLVHANQFQDRVHFLAVGSILTYCDPKSIVWGTGFLSQEDKLAHKPARICAVRGPLTREMLLDQGAECPEIYGDPVLLMPRYYKPEIKKRHKLGAVLHWSNTDLAWKFKNPILPNLPAYGFIDRILECDRIISSSLHGMIIAHAYGIPAEQMALGPEHYQFKFDDFYQSREYLDLDKLLEVCPFKKGE